MSGVVFLADESGATTYFEVGREHRRDPVNRTDVRERASTGEGGSERTKANPKNIF